MTRAEGLKRIRAAWEAIRKTPLDTWEPSTTEPHGKGPGCLLQQALGEECPAWDSDPFRRSVCYECLSQALGLENEAVILGALYDKAEPDQIEKELRRLERGEGLDGREGFTK